MDSIERVPDAYDECANCGRWHYTHGHPSNQDCKAFVKEEEAMTTPTTPAQVRPELAGAWQKVQSAITFGWHKQLESFEARALAEEHDALQSQLSNEQLVAQHYKESCDILRERAEAAQQAVAEREARIAELIAEVMHYTAGTPHPAEQSLTAMRDQIRQLADEVRPGAATYSGISLAARLDALAKEPT